MKYITAFFMAWGNFLTLPCPVKKWDSKLNNWMLAFLPVMGLIIGGIWAMGILFLRFLNDMIGMPEQVGAFLAMCIPFALCGMFHLDGFMDVTDAVLSRRDLSERQRILKDPTVGSFAVISVVFLLLAWYAAMSGLWLKGSLTTFVLIPITSRAVAGEEVMMRRPMGTSQYKETFRSPEDRKAAMILGVQVGLLIVAMIAAGYKDVAVIPIVAAVGLITSAYCRSRLGGMNGDIAGTVICVSEIAGLIVWSMIL